MRLLVTGANGMLGHRVVGVARERGHDVRGTDLPELDLTDADAVQRFADDFAPDAVINCAAYTAVDQAEAEEELATRINGDAAGNLARSAPYVVHVSTDYVFGAGGERDTPYVESDEPRPLGAYARSKVAGEQQVLGAGPQHAVVRTAWLYGEGGKNFVDTMVRLGVERDEVRVVFDQIGSPSYTGHVAPALLDIAERGGAGVFHAANSGMCSWFELAVEAMRVAGLSCRVVAIPTEEFPTPTERPKFSALASEREDGVVRPPWQEGVASHVTRGVPA
jgi:dTDP-4-dehydrorhamnose reductase